MRALAASLRKLGLQTGDRVILCAENSSSWAICDLAILAAGGIVVPAYTTHTPRDHAHQLEDSGASFIICSSGRIGAGLIEVAKERAEIKAAILIPGADQETKIPKQGKTTFPIHQSENLWVGSSENNKIAIEGGGTQTCCIIYTSGTGGQPKG